MGCCNSTFKNFVPRALHNLISHSEFDNDTKICAKMKVVRMVSYAFKIVDPKLTQFISDHEKRIPAKLEQFYNLDDSSAMDLANKYANQNSNYHQVWNQVWTLFTGVNQLYTTIMTQ